MIIEAHDVLTNFWILLKTSGILISLTGNQNMLMLYLHVFCDSMFSLEIFSTHFTLIYFKCLLHMKKHLYEVITVTFVERSSRLNGTWKNISKKSTYIFLFPVNDIKISDNFYNILNFLRTFWAPGIMHKYLLHLIIWMFYLTAIY